MILKEFLICFFMAVLRVITFPFTATLVLLTSVMFLIRDKLKNNEKFSDFYDRVLLWAFSPTPFGLIPLTIFFWLSVICFCIFV